MKEDFTKINEAKYVEHIFEFVRFYKNHQKLNEEIAGLKPRRFFEFGKEKLITITRSNFWMGIKELNSFIIDNTHYISRYSDMKKIEEEFEKLELDFTSDKQYEVFAENERKGEKLSDAEDIAFNIKYLKYVIRCFELGYKLTNLLKSNLMINIKQTKSLAFKDDKQFFESLSNYRNYLMDDLANFRVKNTINHFKRVLGYYYTYKALFVSKEISIINPLISNTFNIITSDESRKIIIDAKTNINVSNVVKAYGMDIKYIFQKMYVYTNFFLMERNILPKNKPRLNEDFTLI